MHICKYIKALNNEEHILKNTLSSYFKNRFRHKLKKINIATPTAVRQTRLINYALTIK